MKNLFTYISLFSIVFLAGLSKGQTVLTVEINNKISTAKAEIYSLNLQKSFNPAIAGDAAFKAKLEELRPKLLRYHAAEQIKDGHAYNWINYTTKTWNKTKINDVLKHKPASVTDVLITIMGWPTWMSGTGGKLASTKKDEYASFCASLVDIVNNQLGYKVKYWEAFNERDGGIYKGSADMAELADIHKRCHDAMKAKDPTIKIVGAAWRQPYDSDIDAFLSNLEGGYLDVWSHHNYGGGDETDITKIYGKAHLEKGITSARNKLNAKGYSNVPIWLDEWNIYWAWDCTGYGNMTSNVGAVFDALVYKYVIEQNKADALFAWNAEDGRYGKIKTDFSGYNPGGELLKLLSEYAIGDVVKTTSANASKVEGFTVKNSSSGSVMFVLMNKSQATENISLNVTGWNPENDKLQKKLIAGNGLSESIVSWNTDIEGKSISVPANSVTILIAVSSPTGINDTHSDNEIKLFPNPANHSITIEGTKGACHFEIYDIMGKWVLGQVNVTNSSKIDISGLRQGIYFYHIVSDDRILQTGKLIKQ